jgi:hypothetical protein
VKESISKIVGKIRFWPEFKLQKLPTILDESPVTESNKVPPTTDKKNNQTAGSIMQHPHTRVAK